MREHIQGILHDLTKQRGVNNVSAFAVKLLQSGHLAPADVPIELLG